MIRLLALDPGITRQNATGWAWRVGDVVQSGQVVLQSRTRKTRGRRFEYFRDWLLDMVDEVAPDVIVYEAPPIARGGLKGRLSLLGLLVVTEEVASRWGIDVRGVAPASAKKKATGSGKATKAEVQAAMAKRYPDQVPFLGADQADALAVLEWARTEVLGFPPRGKAGER